MMSSLASIFLWALHQIETFANFCQGSGIPGVAQAGAALAKALNFLQVNISFYVPLASLTLVLCIQSYSGTQSSAPTTPTTVTTVTGSNCTIGRDRLAHLPASNPQEEVKPDPITPSAPSDRPNVGLIPITGDFKRWIDENRSHLDAIKSRCVVHETRSN